MDMRQRVREILMTALELPESEVDTNAPLITGLGVTSVQLVDLLAALENEFDIEIDNDDIEHMETAEDVVSFLEGNLGS